MRLDRVLVVGAVVLALPLLAGSPPAVAGEGPACPKGGDDAATITLAQRDGQCVVAQPVAPVCVHGGGKIDFVLVNEDCVFDEAKTAVEISEPKPKGGQKPFKYEGCVPKKNGWKAKEKQTISCKVPKGTDDGLYKYDVSGQVKRLDPDIEVRRGGGS